MAFKPQPPNFDETTEDNQDFVASAWRWNHKPGIITHREYITNDHASVRIGTLEALPEAEHSIRLTVSFKTVSNSVVRFRFSDNLAWYDFTNHANAIGFRGAVSWGTGGQQKGNWLDGTNTTANGIALAYIRSDQLCHAGKPQQVEITLLNMGGNRILVSWNFRQYGDAGVLMHYWCKGLIDYDIKKIKRMNLMADTGVFSVANIHAEWI